MLNKLREEIRNANGGSSPIVYDPFAGGGAIPLEAMRLGCEVTASDLNPVAWLILKCTLDYPRQFAGLRWPLPQFVREWPDFVADFLSGKVKKRTAGRKHHFSDPAQLALTSLPDADIGWQVRAWGRWVLERAKADLTARYPKINGQQTVAYLWARTARDKTNAGRIPLLKTFWLSKTPGRKAALLPIPNADRSAVTFQLLRDRDLDNPVKLIAERPFLRDWEVQPDNFLDFIESGTMNKSGTWSPLSGRPDLIALTKDDLSRQGKQGLLSTQMTAVVHEIAKPNSKTTIKSYRLPNAAELAAAEVEADELANLFSEIPFETPSEAIIEDAKKNTWCVGYGFDSWDKLFTPRQLIATGVFLKHTRAAIVQLRKLDPKSAEAVGSYLSLALDRLIDRGSAVCSWTIGYDKIRNTFAGFRLPVAWDYAECVPFYEASGGYPGQLELVAKFLSKGALTDSSVPMPTIIRQSAIAKSLRNVDLIITDPPYYDAIGYSVIMDYFYVWLRRVLTGFWSSVDEAFASPLSPKWDKVANDGELVDDAVRFGGDPELSKRNYEDGMARAFQSFCDSLKDTGRLVVVFANKSVNAWETLVGGLIRGGAVVTASWPIRTEREARSRNQGAAALSSSVWIVCRKRSKVAAPGWEERVVDQMKKILFSPREELGNLNVLQYYFDLGIRGPDFFWAAIGPALEAYSAHPFVKKTAGGLMTVSEFLTEVRRLVLHFSLGELPGFREVQKETEGRGETLELDPVTQYYLLHRAYFGLKPAPAGACILYANACGKNETELKLVWNILEQGGKGRKHKPADEDDDDDLDESVEEKPEGKGNEYSLVDWKRRTSRDGLGDAKAGQAAPLIDKLHRLMHVFQQGRTVDVQKLFETWGLANERAFKPVLQAVRELAVRDRQDDERRLVEALATQLRMNRKTVMVANEMKEVSLFDAVEDETAVHIN
jgi:adenine-specific DNA methylase